MRGWGAGGEMNGKARVKGVRCRNWRTREEPIGWGKQWQGRATEADAGQVWRESVNGKAGWGGEQEVWRETWRKLTTKTPETQPKQSEPWQPITWALQIKVIILFYTISNPFSHCPSVFTLSFDALLLKILIIVSFRLNNNIPLS